MNIDYIEKYNLNHTTALYLRSKVKYDSNVSALVTVWWFLTGTRPNTKAIHYENI